MAETHSGAVYTPTQLKMSPEALPDFDGKHLWMVIAMWKVDPVKMNAGDQVLMDQENLLQVMPVACCFWCEQTWSWPLNGKRCPGDGDFVAEMGRRRR